MISSVTASSSVVSQQRRPQQNESFLFRIAKVVSLAYLSTFEGARGACPLFPSSNPFALGTNDNNDGGFMRIVPLSNQTAWVLWAQNSTSMAGTGAIYQATTNTTARIANGAWVSGSPSNFVNSPGGALFPDGKRFACWSDTTFTSDNPFYEILTSNGTAALFQGNLALPSPSTEEPVLCRSLANGNMLLGHQTGSQLYAREIAESGAVVPTFNLNQALAPISGSTFGWPFSFAEFPGSTRLFVLNRNKIGGGAGNGLLAYPFNTTGGLMSAPVQLDTASIALASSHHDTVYTPSGAMTAFACADGNVRLVVQGSNAQILSTQVVAAGNQTDITYNGVDTVAILYQSAGSVYVQLYNMATVTNVGCVLPLNNVVTGNDNLPSGAFLSANQLHVAWRTPTGYLTRSFALNQSPYFNTALPSPSITIGVPGNITLGSYLTDPQGDPLSLSVTPVPSGFSWNATSTTLSWNLPGAYPKGPITFNVTANDGYYRGVVNATFTVTVLDRPPVVLSSPSIIGFVGDSLSLPLGTWIAANVTDPDQDPVTVSTVANLPAGFSYNSVSETISGIVPAGANRMTFTPVIVTITDGIDLVNATIPVSFPNRPPVVGSIAPQTATVGVPFSYTISVAESDPDGDTLTNHVFNLPSSFAFNPFNNQVTGTATSGDLGVHSILYSVQDQSGLTANATWTLTVSNPITQSKSDSAKKTHSKSKSHESHSESHSHESHSHSHSHHSESHSKTHHSHSDSHSHHSESHSHTHHSHSHSHSHHSESHSKTHHSHSDSHSHESHSHSLSHHTHSDSHSHHSHSHSLSHHSHSKSPSLTETFVAPPQFLVPPLNLNVIAGNSFQTTLTGSNVTDTFGFQRVTLSLQDSWGTIPVQDGVSLTLVDPLDHSKGYLFKINPSPGAISEPQKILWIVATNPAGQKSHLVVDYAVWSQIDAKPEITSYFANVLQPKDSTYSTSIPYSVVSSPLGDLIDMSVTVNPANGGLSVVNDPADYRFTISGTVEETVTVTISGTDTINGLSVNTTYTVGPSTSAPPTTIINNNNNNSKSSGAPPWWVSIFITPIALAAIRSGYMYYKYPSHVNSKYKEKGVLSAIRALMRLTFFTSSEVAKIEGRNHIDMIQRQQSSRQVELNFLQDGKV